MIARDWRLSPPSDIAPFFETERTLWLATLHWDTRASWGIVESARAAGTLPGFVATDEQGTIHGWTFYLWHDQALQVGAFVADSPEATAVLLDAIVVSPHAATASAWVVFAFSIAPDLTAELKQRGFAVERYRYMEVAITGSDLAAQDAGPVLWSEDTPQGIPALLASAYPLPDPARSFARHGQPHEWADYVRQLLTTTGCGTFLPQASFVVPGESSSRPDGATVVTRLSADTVHLAQIAVAPDARGRGLARRLIAASLAAASAAGFARATLLVSERNQAARALYDRLGFQESAVFVSAVCDQPRRSTSAALDTGGAITRR
jgi:ribosomal protein S18 acetylase RimI-like enzyme